LSDPLNAEKANRESTRMNANSEVNLPSFFVFIRVDSRSFAVKKPRLS